MCGKIDCFYSLFLFFDFCCKKVLQKCENGVIIKMSKDIKNLFYERKEKKMNTAQIILQQINAQDPWAMMSWGATDLKAIGQYRHYSGALSFQVNGLKCREAQVVIWHNAGNDLYEIRLVKGEETVETKLEVYCDQLITVLDHMIEGKDGKDLTMDEIVNDCLN